MMKARLDKVGARFRSSPTYSLSGYFRVDELWVV